jgi:nitronate monooxygenase
MDELSANVLVRHTARTLDIPVLAAGGYADGYGLIAALAMGADGITMGTRFIATKECVCHDNFKQWIVQANEADTCLVQKSLRNMMRAAKNDAAAKCMELETNHASVEEVLQICKGSVSKKCYETGDTQGSIFPVGQVVGLIDDVPSVAELIERIITEAKSSLARIEGICS